MAALVVGLSMNVTSCKDDDDDNNNGTEQQGGDSAEGMVSMADTQLGDLICQWCDVQADELTGSDWRTKTYEVTEGVVTDASIPTERSVQVGSLAEADAYALHALNGLGINSSNLNDFSFSDAQVGTVSYHHGGGSDGNTLATIDVNVKQLPGLTRMLLVKTLPDNAGGDPFYRVGDIICYEKKGQTNYAVCVSEHTKNQKALFVTMNDQSQHKTGTFNWRGVGQDTVYSDRMASSQALYLWLKNIVFDENRLASIRTFMTDEGFDEMAINQVAPATESQRHSLVRCMSNQENLVCDVMMDEDLSSTIGMHSGASMAATFSWSYKDEEMTVLISAPHGHLLTNILRWSEHFLSSWDQWVPYLFLVKDKEYSAFETTLNKIAPMTTLSPSHFKWEDLGTVQLTKELNECSYLISTVKPAVFHVLLVATYWQHKAVDTIYGEEKILFNFTKDASQHPESKMRKQYTEFGMEAFWDRMEITSSEISFTDKGVAKKGYTTVYRERNN